jgi:hypothetical protein
MVAFIRLRVVSHADTSVQLDTAPVCFDAVLLQGSGRQQGYASSPSATVRPPLPMDPSLGPDGPAWWACGIMWPVARFDRSVACCVVLLYLVNSVTCNSEGEGEGERGSHDTGV